MDQELVTTESKGPPLPKWAYAIVNPLMRGVLRSPLHSLLSGALMALSFSGRRSGRRYTIPVGYMEEGSKLYLFSHAAWAKNFVGGAPVVVRLRGQERRGTARIVEDPSVIMHFLRRMVAERGEQMAARMGFVERTADGRTRLGRPAGSSFVEIELE
jgi:hypothetical protein